MKVPPPTGRGWPKVTSVKNRTHAVRHDIYAVLAISKLERRPRQPHLICPVQEKLPHMSGKEPSACSSLGITGWKLHVERNKPPDWFAEVKHILQINNQPREQRFQAGEGLMLLMALSFGRRRCYIWMSQQRTLTHLRVNRFTHNNDSKFFLKHLMYKHKPV